MDRQYEVIDDILPDDGCLRLDGIRYATGEELRIFQSGNVVYDTDKLKSLR